MNKNKKYIITRSNYTVKKKHKSLDSNRTIYERDFMVTSLNDNWGGNNSSYGVSSFKMVRNTKSSGHYRYNTGEWLKQDNCSSSPEIWTSNCLSNTKKNSENHIEPIPNSNSLLDFAYYRSCKDLLETSVNDIIKKFPGELYFTSNIREIDDEGEIRVYEIENPFLIDLYSRASNNLNENNLRIFSQSYNDYVIIKTDSSKSNIVGVEIEEETRLVCAKDGDLLFTISIVDGQYEIYDIEAYFIANQIVYTFDDEDLIGMRIRPMDNKIEDFFNNLDKFQKVMLNRDVNPLYTMYLDYPHETDNGIETYKKYFTWPTTIDGGWNLDISDVDYQIYIKDLLKLCDFYDTRRTNNLWRVMVHDSIKNMDYAFKNDKIEDDEYEFGESKFEKIIKCYAKQFDDIKQYIDNIKTVNNITYDNNGNTPNYFLSDKLELGGWEVYNLANSLNENSKVSGNNLFTNINKVYNVNDVNVNLMKNLFINSRDIISRKGTKHGIEMMLSLFGLTSYDHNKTNYDYKITEYVNTVTNNNHITYDDVIKYNIQKKTYEERYPAFEVVENDPLQGLPIRKVEYETESGENRNYLIPWFDNNQIIDGDVYFQMHGGWCKTFKKDINNNTNNNDDIVASNTVKIYDESIKYLLVVKRINDLKFILKNKLYEGCIVYVININDFDSIYTNDEIRNITLNGDNGTLQASHYFILDNNKNSYIIGSNKNENGENVYGWENITVSEIEMSNTRPNNDRGLKVRLMESIVEDHKGNNPHGGYGKYDDGEAFVDHFRQIFKYSIDNDNFNDALYTCENGELDEAIENIGFDIVKQKDNVKTWYFSDSTTRPSVTNSLGGLLELTRIVEEKNGTTTYIGKEYENVKCTNYRYTFNQQGEVNVGKNNNYTFFESELTPFDFENMGKSYDESTANSIINDKKLLIEFSGPITTYENFPLFLQNGILPYLKQVIPSTTILEIDIEGGYGGYTTLPFIDSNVEEEINE